MEYPQLPMEIETVNVKLVDHFGIDTITGHPIWRVSWSDDQYEKRLSDRTPKGFQLLYPEVQLLPKYQWVCSKWILERLVLIPELNQNDLPTQKQSYECMYVFENTYTHMIVPTFEACKFIVDTVYAAMGKKSMAKYVDDEAKNPIETREARIDKLQEELFGDESSLLLRTVTGEAVAYTGEPKIDVNKKKES